MGRHEGKAVFVPFAAPGDSLEVEIVNKHKSYDNAVIKNIVVKGDCRVEPECRYYGICGGCQLQHINYDAQLLWKSLILEEQLIRIGGIAGQDIPPVIPSPKIWEYRNRIQVHKRKNVVGFLKRESDKIVDIEYCPVADPEVNKELSEVRKKWPGSDKRIELSKEGGDSFSQINPHVNEIMKKLVTRWAGEGDHENILELYAGSGNLTFHLSKIAKNIVAVESDSRAVDEGREKSAGNVEFICSSVEKSLPSLDGRGWGRVTPLGLALMDPPRDGLGRKVVNGILKLTPQRIIYVSCNPSTLARDLKQVLSKGYKIKRIQPLDMFPQTYHIESVVELRKA